MKVCQSGEILETCKVVALQDEGCSDHWSGMVKSRLRQRRFDTVRSDREIKWKEITNSFYLLRRKGTGVG